VDVPLALMIKGTESAQVVAKKLSCEYQISKKTVYLRVGGFFIFDIVVIVLSHVYLIMKTTESI
jgi:hypothetical protein